jgi:predicted Zn-dependent protease
LIAYAAARGFPVEFFTAEFEPDLAALRRLHAQYRNLTPPDNLKKFIKSYVAKAEQAAEQSKSRSAAALWLEAHGLWLQLDDIPGACEAARMAVAADPNHYEARRAWGTYLLEQQQFAEAEEALKWCQMRRPTDPGLAAMVERATKGRIDTQTQAAVGASDAPWR